MLPITLPSYPIITDQQPPFIEYDLIRTSSGVCISCTFPKDSSSTGCVAVVHQRISGVNSTGLVNILASHKFNRSISDDTAHGCIEGINLEQYQVGVVGGKMTMEPNGKSLIILLHIGRYEPSIFL